MRNLAKRHSEFIGNVAVLMSGKGFAAAIALITVPIVARLFEPGHFGVAAMFASYAGIASSVAALRYESAIVLPESDAQARHLMGLAYRIAAAASALLFLVIFLEGSGMGTWSGFELVGDWKWALPVAIFLWAMIHIQENWLTRNKHFKIASASLIAGNSATSITRIGLGFAFGSSVGALIAGYLVGLLARILTPFRSLLIGLTSFIGTAGFSKDWKLARDYKDFPTLNAPAGLIFAFGQNLPVVAFGLLYSPAIAGMYAMADRLAQAPISIVSLAIRRVFAQKAAELSNQGKSLRRPFKLTVLGLGLIGAAPFIVVFGYGQELCAWILGSRWIEAGSYLEIMSVWLLSMWMESPCNPVFVVHRRQDLWLILQSTTTVFRICSFALAYLLALSTRQALIAFVCATVLGNAVTIAAAYRLTGNRPEHQSAQ